MYGAIEIADRDRVAKEIGLRSKRQEPKMWESGKGGSESEREREKNGCYSFLPPFFFYPSR